jgi:hypothetical protein
LAKINRQQFNKYLSCQSQPSLSSLRKLNDFFGLEEDELLLPPTKFKQLISIRPKPSQGTADEPFERYIASVNDCVEQASDFLKPYLGLYHDYYYSPSNPGYLMKGLVSLYQKDGKGFIRSIERLPYKDKNKTRHFHTKYHGIATVIQDRLIFTDIETKVQSNWGQRIYYPANRARIDLLSGLSMAIEGGLSHQPFCSRAVLERLDDDVNLKEVIGECSLYAVDSPLIRDDIKEKLGLHLPLENTMMVAKP